MKLLIAEVLLILIMAFMKLYLNKKLKSIDGIAGTIKKYQLPEGYRLHSDSQDDENNGGRL